MNNIEIYNEDCFKFLKNLEGDSVDLVLIDPPYNIGIDSWDKWEKQEDYYSFMFNVFQECERVLKKNGTLLWFHSDRQQIPDLIQQCRKSGLTYISDLIVYKENFRARSWKNLKESNALRSWFNVNEYVFHFVKTDKDSNKTGTDIILNDINHFKEQREYSRQLMQRIGKTKKQINEEFGSRSMEHFFYWKSCQFSLPLEKNYNELLALYNISVGEQLESFKVLTYQELKNSYNKQRDSYESQRREVESKRYVFNTGILQGYKNVYHISNNMSQSGKNKKHHNHSTQKDLKLIEDLIKVHSNENDLVVDCFLGTGTTAIASKNTNRKFKGCERDENYFKYCLKELKE